VGLQAGPILYCLDPEAGLSSFAADAIALPWLVGSVAVVDVAPILSFSHLIICVECPQVDLVHPT